jgi:type II secretory pathway pseudopilin PulG
MIELIMVIVVLGILAAVALPKFANFSSDAKDAVAKNIAGSISSATHLNYMQSLAQGNFTGLTNIKSGVSDCNSLKHLMQGGFSKFPEDVEFTRAANPIACTPAEAGGINTTSCLIKHKESDTTFAVKVTCSS